jgi:hypothetical protein
MFSFFPFCRAVNIKQHSVRIIFFFFFLRAFFLVFHPGWLSVIEEERPDDMKYISHSPAISRGGYNNNLMEKK